MPFSAFSANDFQISAGKLPPVTASPWNSVSIGISVVGYPTTLRPMLTEFRGEAVTGGSFPALIWKSFAEKALKDEEPLGFPNPGMPYGAPKLVTRRGERLLLDNGLCKTRQEVVYFAGTGPSKSANCVENEVEVPDVRKLSLAVAEARVAAQPLTAKLLQPRSRCSGPASSSTSGPRPVIAHRSRGSSSSSRRRPTA